MEGRKKRSPVRWLAERSARIYAGSRYLRALMQGLVMLLPLILIMAVLDLIAGFPFPPYQAWYASEGAEAFRHVVSLLGGMFSDYKALYLVLTVCLSYGRLSAMKSRESVSLVFAGEAVLFLFSLPSLMIRDLDPRLSPLYGHLLGIVATALVCAVYDRVLGLGERVGRQEKGRVREGRDVRAHRGKSTQSRGEHRGSGRLFFGDSVRALLISLALALVLECCFRGISGGRTLQELVTLLVGPLITAHPLAGTLVLLLLVMLLWAMGIHGQSFFFLIWGGYYLGLLNENVTVGAHHILNWGFFHAYLLLGGCGSVMALLIVLLLRSKREKTRRLARISIVPVLFNVSETLVYGLPIAWNAALLVPFIAAPVVNCVIAYAATAVHLVPIINVKVSWSMPIFFSGYLATGSMAGAVLQVILLLVDVLLYWPFVPALDAMEEEGLRLQAGALTGMIREQERTVQRQRLCDLPGELGETARALVKDLARDLEENRLYLVFQPQRDAQGEFAGVEALLRWRHDTCGYVYPPLIIELAIEGGLLGRVEEFVFAGAAAAVRTLEERGDCACKVSANITGSSPGRDGFVEMVEEACRREGISPEHLWLEITEQDTLDTSVAALDRMRVLHARGHRFLIDDFGTGHTSIDYLRMGLFDGLKLDGRITTHISESERDQDIVRSIAQMAHTMGMEVTAEYVEEMPQRILLQDLGCDAFQGFLYSPAVPMPDVCALLDGERERRQKREVRGPGEPPVREWQRA